MWVDVEKAKKILEHYGKDHQIVKACEELSELQTILLQIHNKPEMNRSEHHLNMVNVLQEIADVYVMLKQLEIALRMDSRDIEPVIEFKLDRALGAIDEQR